MANYCPNLVEDLTARLNAMTGAGLTQNDTFRLLESIREQYGLPDPFEAFLDGLLAEQAPAAEPEPTPIPKFRFSDPVIESVKSGSFQDAYSSKASFNRLTPDEALTRLHTMRPADPAFTRTYLGDAA